MYNSVTTPRQGQYHLVLSDGTNVWLDAESSIRFPVSFDDTCRRVELTGQAYFEVAHNQQQPFIVHIPLSNSDVRVLGTHFNIMAYKDESAVRTTLLEGAVRVNNVSGAVLLKPGQQAAIKNSNSSNAAIAVQRADTERVMAWKNGMFHFGNTPIDEIMRQVARWYDADVHYKGSIANLQFSGQVARTSNVSELLQLLEATGTVHFEVNGKNITVIAKE
jgi:ferric-dicitrate binding protein FerR (iron transport regulator)